MKTFQDWCIRMLAVAFMGKDRLLVAGESGKMEKGYDQVIVGALLGQYPHVYVYNGRNVVFNDVDYHKKELLGKDIWKNLLCSKAAQQAIAKLNDVPLKDLKKENAVSREYPHYMCTETKSYSFDRIMAMDSAGTDDIRSALLHSKLVIVTRREADELEGRGIVFDQKDEKLVRSWEPAIGAEAAEEAAGSMKKENGSWLACKSSGSAYARIAHLINAGVEFSWGKSSADPEAVNDIRVIKEYLDSNDWTVREFGEGE